MIFGCWTILVWGEFGVKEREHFVWSWEDPTALEVRDRYGEAIVMLGRVDWR
jgi:hypothetical protein